MEIFELDRVKVNSLDLRSYCRGVHLQLQFGISMYFARVFRPIIVPAPSKLACEIVYLR